MTIQSILDAVSDVLMAGVGGRVRYVGAPIVPPQAVPAVYVAWEQSSPTTATHSKRDANNKLVKHGVARRHTVLVYVIGGPVVDGVAAEEAQRTYAQQIMDTVDADETMRGTTDDDRVAKASITRVEPWADTLSNTPLFGVVATMEVIEL